MRVSLYYKQLFIICFSLISRRSGLLGREVFFMQFGLIMIKFSKCKKYFIKPINCFVQMLYIDGVGVFVSADEERQVGVFLSAIAFFCSL